MHRCELLQNPIVLLTSFALHPPTRFLLSNSDELEISRLLRQMIGRPLLQPTSSMMMVALFSSQKRSSAVARFAHFTSGQVVGLDLFSGRLFSGNTGGFQANYTAKIVRQRSLRTRTELPRRSRRTSWRFIISPSSSQ